jgi:hypothetical protein
MIRISIRTPGDGYPSDIMMAPQLSAVLETYRRSMRQLDHAHDESPTPTRASSELPTPFTLIDKNLGLAVVAMSCW